jgi:hypothetical protein
VAFTLEFRDKAGAYTAVPLQDGTSARLRQQFEGPNREILYDDLTIDLVDVDGAWAALFTQANLPPTDVYPSLYGFRVKRDGAAYWEGDLDYSTVDVDTDKAKVTVHVLDALKRCMKKDAQVLKRDYSSLAIVDGVKESRVMAVNAVVDASGYSLVAGDEITVGHYKPTWNSGSKLFQQTLKVESVDSAPAWVAGSAHTVGDVVTWATMFYRCIKDHVTGYLPSNTTYWTRIIGHIITFKRKMQAHYLAGDAIIVKDPWMRDLTAGVLVGMLADLVPGFDTAGNRVVNYTPTAGDDVVPVADFNGCNVGQALEKLAYWVNAHTYTRLNILYFVGREASQDPATLKTIDALLVSGPVRPVDDSRYDQVVVKGRDKRYARRGLSPYGGKKLDLELPFSGDHDQLQGVCDRLWDYWSPRRQGIPKATVADDGFAWQLKQRVSCGSVEYFTTSVSIPLNDGADVELELLAKTGTTVPTSITDVDTEAEDEFDPPEPLNFVMTKTYSTTFNTLYPEAKYPRISVRREQVGDVGGDPIYANVPYRLYELRWEYPYDEVLSRVWMFEITIWPDGKDREKPELRLAVVPILQADGFYYAKRYMRAGQIWWADVLARYDNLKEGIPSDSDSSVNETLATGDDVTPAIPTIYSLASYEQDKPGTRYVECDLKVSLTWVANSTDMVDIQVQDGTLDTVRNVFVVVPSAGADTITLKAKYRRGNTLTVKVRGRKGSSAWSALTTTGVPIVAGSSSGDAPLTTPPTPTVLTTHRGTKRTRIKLQLSGTTADKKGITHLEIYTAPRGTSTATAPDSSTLWDTLPELSLEHYTKRGKYVFWVEVEHRDINQDGSLDRPAIAIRAVGNQSDTPSGWLYFETLFEGWIQMVVDPLAGPTPDIYTLRFYPVASGGSGTGRQWKWDFGDGSGTEWQADSVGYYVDHTYAMRPEPTIATVTLQAKDDTDNRFEATTEVYVGGTSTQDTQLRKPATVTSETNAHSGATSWSNPSNVASASDADYASVVLAASAFSQDLKCVAYGLDSAASPPPGDALPFTGIVKGLAFSVEIEATVADKISWDKVQLTYAGVAMDPPRVISSKLEGSKKTVLLGSFGDRWKTGLTLAKLRASTFGLLLAFYNSAATAQTVKVYNVKARAWADDGS